MRRIFVAEDDPALRRLYRIWLESDGCDVLEAADGREALALLERERLPDGAVLDVNMPYVDGLSVCRYLRMRAPDIPIVIVSGMRAVAAEATAVLTKPCDCGELLAALGAAQRFNESVRWAG
jgi:two-component system response regulator MprA